MLLRDLLTQYVAQHDYGVSQGHQDQMAWSIAAWEKVADCRLTIEDLCDERLNAYLDWLRSHRRPDTVRSRRGNLLTLWRFAWLQGIVRDAPRHVRRLRHVEHVPEAWTAAEIAALFDAASHARGRFHASVMRRGPWWSSLVRAAYDTSLRLGDLLALEVNGSLPNPLRIVQHKTGRQAVVQLRPATLAAIDQTLADQPRARIWLLWGTRQTFYEHFRRLVADAGIRPGTFRWIRRTAITQLERVAPGQGTRLAGHAHRSTTETWYIDVAQLDPAPLPPL